MPATKKKATTKATTKATIGATTKTAASKPNAGNGRKHGASNANRGLMKPMQPDAQLAAIIGDQPMPRTEITKRIWDYVKSNNLQDENNRRMINADEKLKTLFGGKKRVSMFEMTKLISAHIK
jgi:chromatin remodeling complex protein RSC6